MKTRIALVSTNLARGGAETQVARLAAGLRRRGWEVSVISLLPPTAFERELAAAGVSVHSLDMQPGFPNPLGYARLLRILRDLRPQMVHSHMFHANLLARAARLISPVPVLVSTLHSVAESGRGSSDVGRRDWLYRVTDPLADLTVAVCQAVAERHAEARAVPGGNSASFRTAWTQRLPARLHPARARAPATRPRPGIRLAGGGTPDVEEGIRDAAARVRPRPAWRPADRGRGAAGIGTAGTRARARRERAFPRRARRRGGPDDRLRRLRAVFGGGGVARGVARSGLERPRLRGDRRRRRERASSSTGARVTSCLWAIPMLWRRPCRGLRACRPTRGARWDWRPANTSSRASIKTRCSHSGRSCTWSCFSDGRDESFRARLRETIRAGQDPRLRLRRGRAGGRRPRRRARHDGGGRLLWRLRGTRRGRAGGLAGDGHSRDPRRPAGFRGRLVRPGDQQPGAGARRGPGRRPEGDSQSAEAGRDRCSASFLRATSFARGTSASRSRTGSRRTPGAVLLHLGSARGRPGNVEGAGGDVPPMGRRQAAVDRHLHPLPLEGEIFRAFAAVLLERAAGARLHPVPLAGQPRLAPLARLLELPGVPPVASAVFRKLAFLVIVSRKEAG